jgi:hypothetical protein
VLELILLIILFFLMRGVPLRQPVHPGVLPPTPGGPYGPGGGGEMAAAERARRRGSEGAQRQALAAAGRGGAQQVIEGPSGFRTSVPVGVVDALSREPGLYAAFVELVDQVGRGLDPAAELARALPSGDTSALALLDETAPGLRDQVARRLGIRGAGTAIA